MVMEWLIPALITAGTSAYAVNESSKGQEDANMQNLAIAENQMKFQEKSFRNRHQWEVEDLRAAGLNPILSATGGQAPVPSGASATMINPKRDSSDIIANSAKSVIDIVNGVMSAKTSQKQQVNIDKEGKILENKIGQSASEKVTAETKLLKVNMMRCIPLNWQESKSINLISRALRLRRRLMSINMRHQVLHGCDMLGNPQNLG